MESIEDRYYIEKVLRGELSGFAPLVDRYKEMAYNLSLKIVRRPEDAEEITQDSFVKAYRSLASFKGDSKFSTWLFRIVYNTSVSHLRKKKREIVSDTLDGKQLNHQEYVEEGSPQEGDLALAALQKAVSILPGEEQTMITLYYYQECSIDDIAGIMDLSVSNVKVRLFRARKKLYDRIIWLMERESPA